MKILLIFCLIAGVGLQATPQSSTSRLAECSLKPIIRTALNLEGGSPLQMVSEESSSNWSGYVGATNIAHPQAGSVSAVTGTWLIPSLHATSNTTYSASWIGIDGFSNGTVEQIGTAQNWVNGKQQNYIWFEMYPNGAYQIVGFPANNGDKITAWINYIGSGVFQMTIENVTRKVYFTVPYSYTTNTSAQRSCAEWIMEAPSSNTGILPLANFGTETFTNCRATIGGVTAPILNNRWQNVEILMDTTSRVVKAAPSKIYGSGQSFIVNWGHQ